MSRPLKPPMSTRDHIALLRQRGMEVDEAQATQWLSNVSYHRLAAYWHPARRLTADGRREDSFVDGTSFADVATLYEADRKLRSLVLDGMERVEITMRTRIGELLCQSDPLLYRESQQVSPWIRSFKVGRYSSESHKTSPAARCGDPALSGQLRRELPLLGAGRGARLRRHFETLRRAPGPRSAHYCRGTPDRPGPFRAIQEPATQGQGRVTARALARAANGGA